MRLRDHVALIACGWVLTSSSLSLALSAPPACGAAAQEVKVDLVPVIPSLELLDELNLDEHSIDWDPPSVAERLGTGYVQAISTERTEEDTSVTDFANSDSHRLIVTNLGARSDGNSVVDWVPSGVIGTRRLGLFSVSITRKELRRWILSSNGNNNPFAKDVPAGRESDSADQSAVLALRLVKPLGKGLEPTPAGPKESIVRGELYTALGGLVAALRRPAGKPEDASLAKQFTALDFLTQTNHLELADCLGPEATEEVFKKKASELRERWQWEEADTLLKIHGAMRGSCLLEHLRLTKSNIKAAVVDRGYVQNRENRHVQDSFIVVAEYVAQAMKSVAGYQDRGSIGIVRQNDMVRFASGEMGRWRSERGVLYDSEPNSMLLLGWCLLYTESAEFLSRRESPYHEAQLWNDWAFTAALASAMYVETYGPSGDEESAAYRYTTSGPFALDSTGAMRNRALKAVYRAVRRETSLSEFVAQRIRYAWDVRKNELASPDSSR